MAYEAMANRDKLNKLEHWGEPVGAELSFLYIYLYLKIHLCLLF